MGSKIRKAGGWVRSKFARPPSDGIIACWRCRALTDEASALEVRPSHLKAWRADNWSLAGWTLVAGAGLGGVFGLFGLGFALCYGDSVARVCSMGMGMMLLGASSTMVASAAYFIDRQLRRLRTMKAEREEMRRLSS